MYQFLFIVLFFFQSLIYAQTNIISNGDFEIYKSCPSNLGQLYLLKDWFVPTNISSTDFYNSCCLNPNGLYSTCVPNNFAGKQFPHSGNGYVGFSSFQGNIGNNAREYLANKLKKTLKSNVKYKLVFYLSLGEISKYAISKSDIGIYFSKDSIAMNQNYDNKPLPFLPQILAGNSSEFLKDTANWIKITSIYKAKGGEKYMTIGNFNNNVNTNYKLINSNSTNSYSYYYIDDVSLNKMITPQNIKLDSLVILTACYDSIQVKITNSGDSALNFTQHPFDLTLKVKQSGAVVQTLQKSIQDNQNNPITGQSLAVDSSFWVYFSGITYPSPTGNYTIEVTSQMAADGDSTNNFLDTTFYREVSVGNVSISDSSICQGESVELYNKNVQGTAIWQFSANQQNWQDIGFSDTLVYAPKQNGFFRLKVCNVYSDTLEIKVNPLPPVINQSFQYCSPGQQMLQIEKNDSISNLNWYKTAQNGAPFHQGFSITTTISQSVNYYLESVKDNCVSKERGVLKITLGGCELEIPNIFTPNGDGINDVFKYRQAEGKTIHTKIYDRWGKQVATFENNEGWTGKDAAAGTYYYVIKTQEKVYRGSVVLVK